MCSANAESALSLNRGNEMKSINCCYIAFAFFAFVSNVLGGYNAPSSNTGAAYLNASVQPSSQILNGKGEIIGFSTQLGKDEITGQNSTQDEVYRLSPQERLVLDSNGDGRVLTPNGNGDLCYDTTKLPNQSQIPRGFEAPVCAKTMDEAVVQTNPMFNNACKNKVEEGLYAKKTTKMYHGNGRNPIGHVSVTKAKVFKRADKGDGNEKKVTLYFNGDEVDAIVHNHPNGSLWPSEDDVITALKRNSDIYINNCKGEYSVFSISDGFVYKIVNGERVSFNEEFPAHVRSDDGHDPYDPKNLETLRAKAKGLEGKNSGNCQQRRSVEGHRHSEDGR